MQLHHLPWSPVVKTLFQHPLALLSGGLLLCLAPVLAPGQSVTFAGTHSILPASGVNPWGIAVDAAGDVFISYTNSNQLVELPRTALGFGTQVALPISGFPTGVAVDGAGNVFFADPVFQRSVELPKTATGYGPQTTLPASGLRQPFGVALDSAGDVFIADAGNDNVVELPKTATGYGPQTTLPASSLNSPLGVAVDSAGDIFIADQGNNRVVDLSKTASGYGPQTTLPASGLRQPFGVALDSAGDVFIADTDNNRVVELPKTSSGYGPQTTLPASGLNSPLGVAVDSTGDVFIGDYRNSDVVEVQTISVNFGGVNVCMPGQTTPAPCGETLTLNFNVNADVTLGTPKVLTGGTPNLDFTLASGSTCTSAFSAGATCTVNVLFAPLATGVRNGSVEITDGSGNVLATTAISGFGVSPPPVIVLDEIIPGPPKQVVLATRDYPSGLKTLDVLECTNCTAVSDTFTVGTNDTVDTTATKTNQSESSTIKLEAIDVAGKVTIFDPVDFEIHDGGLQKSHTVKISPAEHIVMIANGTPGVREIEIKVNGRALPLVHLKDGGGKTIDIEGYISPVLQNRVNITAYGPTGGTSWVVITQP